jgi:hypothetical protein
MLVLVTQTPQMLMFYHICIITILRVCLNCVAYYVLPKRMFYHIRVYMYMYIYR